MEKISHNGSLSTKTDFRLESGMQIRIEVWFTTECTVANQATYYNCNVSTKGKGCRNWIFKFRGENSINERILQLITKEQLYTAYFNHWNKLNPVRMFSDGSVNGEYVNFTVKEKPPQSRHYAF